MNAVSIIAASGVADDADTQFARRVVSLRMQRNSGGEGGGCEFAPCTDFHSTASSACWRMLSIARKFIRADAAAPGEDAVLRSSMLIFGGTAVIVALT